MRRRYSFSPIFLLGLSLGLIFVVSVGGYNLKRYLAGQRQKERNDPGKRIIKILQRGSEREALSTLYLAELLSLSIDHPMNARDFNCAEAAKRLLSSPVIQKATVSLRKPYTVVVDYEIRRPIALLYDYINTGIDNLTIPVPLHPFYSPKNLPEIYLGERIPLEWNQPIDHPKLKLAFSLLKLLASAPFTVKRIDVGLAFSKSYGTRQIILCIEESFPIRWEGKEILCVVPKILRLSAKDYEKDLSNYFVLRQEETQVFDPDNAVIDGATKSAKLPMQIVDLRISGMAFLET